MADFVSSKHLAARRHATKLAMPMAAESEQKQRPKSGDGSGSSAKGDGGKKKIAKRGKELKEEMDSLVDEIDAVLEENAEEFVKNYVQRGGQ